jgi:hypothetical protein
MTGGASTFARTDLLPGSGNTTVEGTFVGDRIVVDPKGRLFTIGSHGTPSNYYVDTLLRMSIDDGQTWTNVFTIPYDGTSDMAFDASGQLVMSGADAIHVLCPSP